MIFNVEGHIPKIIAGTKTQTRRVSLQPYYEIGKTYAIQRGRTKPAIKDGRILITDIKLELKQDRIIWKDAQAEGNYTPDLYESLFSSMHPKWKHRFAYTFKFVPSEEST